MDGRGLRSCPADPGRRSRHAGGLGGLLQARPAYLVVSPKVRIGFRLSPDAVRGIRTTGRGYNAHVEQVLREAFAKHKL